MKCRCFQCLTKHLQRGVQKFALGYSKVCKAYSSTLQRYAPGQLMASLFQPVMAASQQKVHLLNMGPLQRLVLASGRGQALYCLRLLPGLLHACRSCCLPP